ncbi:MAG: metallophosphoesterase [Oscillospiraceae bacterium]|nr:metallophosphoesterase [Oscillospiraceae bacterium]
MTITHKINMDLVSKGIAPKFDMVQGDYCARQIEIRLFSNNTPWSIPENALVMVRYRRPDKSVGIYNTLPDGTSAYTITGGNALSITVTPEALAIPGTVSLVVSLSNRERELSTFEVQIEVQPNLSSGAALDGNYSSITGMLPIPDVAVSGQMLVVDEITTDGKVCTVKAIDAPKSAYQTAKDGGFSGTESEFAARLANVDGSPVPEYVKAEANRVAELVQSRQNANTFSFLAGSDIHARLGEGNYYGQMLTSAQHAAQAMEIIRKQVHLDFCAILGDTLWDSGETQSQAMELYRLMQDCFDPAFQGLPQFWLKGNHDYLTDALKLTDDQVFAGISIHNTGAILDSAYKAGGYCYRDFASHKIRVICMALPIDGKGYNISDQQASWMANALDVSGNGADWKCLILSHTAVAEYTWHSAFKNALLSNKDNIIANIHGHTHNYQVSVIADTDIPQIAIPAICPYRTKDSAGNEISTAPYQKMPNTAEDTAFCVVTIDLENRTLYADHYGAGVDRIVNLTEAPTVIEPEIPSGNYTNLIPCSTSTFGGSDVYNGCGYKTGYRINSSNVESAVSGMCCTGFIPVNKGDVLRFSNITLNGSATSYLLLYTHTGSLNDAFGIDVLGTADSNGVYTYVVPDAGSNIVINAMRLSCGVIDDNSIITVNEEIT